MPDSDPISGSSTPNKRRKLNAENGKAWDSQDDSGDEFTAEDFHTIATVPIKSQLQRSQHNSERNHGTYTRSLSPPRTFMTQPTQTLRISSPSPPPDVLVERSSPPRPIRRPLTKPTSTSFLASAMAPPGTSFRAPLGVQSKPSPVLLNDSDDEPDPPVQHSSEDEHTQGLRLQPTNFKKGGRNLDSTPNQTRVQESPRPLPAAPDTFKNLMSEFEYTPPSTTRSKPAQTLPARALPNAAVYNNIDDIFDYLLRKKVLQIQKDFSWESVQRCMDALTRCHGNVADAKEWLTADEELDAAAENDDIDFNHVPNPGAVHTQSSQPIRPAKQEIKVPTQTIAQKYASSANPARRTSQAEELSDKTAEPRRRRLQQGRKSARSSPMPQLSPQQAAPQPQTHPRFRRKGGVIHDDDSESEPESRSNESTEAQPEESKHDRRLLEFFNSSSLENIVDLSAQPSEVVKFVLDKRPFSGLDDIRCISNITETKSGRASKSRPVGDKIVDICSKMWDEYDVVDELVEKCELIAAPIQETLKSWGNAGNDGELKLMNLNHDSGVGTPASSYTGDDTSGFPKRDFLGQPSSMSSEILLKDYQLVGLNWLSLLWTEKLSCILADEMGLGKTCQVISFLAHLQEQKVDGVSLVIVPGSTLENWLREFQQFAPKLNIFPYYGPQSERAELQHRIATELSSIDVIVTTIDMAVKRDDNRFLCGTVAPVVCVFDEAHALRNRDSDRYKQLSRIPANFRILLTGTPLQNNLQELMAILAFIMPSLFKKKEEDLRFIFQHKASTKDTNNSALLSAQRIARARAMMTPFVLRRKKNQVLDLPAKHNRVEFCNMTSDQRSYYNSLVQDYQENGTRAKGGSSNMLMAVRKAAIHPLLARRLFDDKKVDRIVTELLRPPEFADNDRQRVKDYLIGDHYQSFKGGDYGLHRFCHARDYLRKFELKKTQWMDSGKVAKFQELVQAFASNRDRVLVFSQFTTMMDILETVLETLHIKFMRLDGSTDMQIRQDMIDKFTDDETITVFMLSTKAGGAGINLASANKVIRFDSGFNPQDDIQAENRAHRVGQTREVEVIRLVTRGTIEEQIHSLGESKLELGVRVAEGATASEGKQAEKAGEKMVEKMFLDSLKGNQTDGSVLEIQDEPAKDLDLKDAFKCGLENAGVRVSSKQAQF